MERKSTEPPSSLLKPPSLLFRVDAGVRRGNGHVMRCLALAQEWIKTGGRCLFVMSTGTPKIVERLKAEGIQVILTKSSSGDFYDASTTISLASEHHADWIVLDGYHFDEDYQERIQRRHIPLLVIDDSAPGFITSQKFHADVILNQNLHATPSLYSKKIAHAADTTLLLGPTYSLLRKEFCSVPSRPRETPEVARRIIITLGGTDPNNATQKILKALTQVPINALGIVVVIGAGNPHLAELRQEISRLKISVRLEVNASNMASLFSWTDVAISGGGSTVWELASMGVPSLTYILADNQEAVAISLAEHRIARNEGWIRDRSSSEIATSLHQFLLDHPERKRQTEKGPTVVDGRGTQRVCSHLKEKILRLRPVRERDCRQLWEWANDPSVRQASFDSGNISWEEHLHWFGLRHTDPNCLFYIATDAHGSPIGQARFDLEEGEAKISVSVDKNLRNAGWGGALIRKSSQEVLQVSGVKRIHSFIKSWNQNSCRAFVQAGYRKLEEIENSPEDHAENQETISGPIMHFVMDGENRDQKTETASL